MESPQNRNGLIGVFDSGFGGLDILRCIVKKLPQYHYIYLGDTQRSPYGARTQEAIYKFTEQAVNFLFNKGCELIILACNTASAEALRRIQQEHLPKFFPEKKVLGVIIPAVEAAIEQTKNNRLGVIATEGTVNSGAFAREILKRLPKAHVFQAACPLLVPIVEAGEKDAKIIQPILRKYLKPLLDKKIDTLILGCTHYGFLKREIKENIGKGVATVAEGPIVAEKLADYLKRHQEIEQKLSRAAGVDFFTTDLTDKFKQLGGQFFGRSIKPIKVELI